MTNCTKVKYYLKLNKNSFPVSNSPYFFNKTTLVAENKPNNPKPYYLILTEKNEAIRLV